MSSMNNVTKLKSPGTSTMLDYVVNIYQNGKFKVAYRYEGWSGTAVHDEVKWLRQRFPSDKGYSLDW